MFVVASRTCAKLFTIVSTDAGVLNLGGGDLQMSPISVPLALADVMNPLLMLTALLSGFMLI